ncbi:hypothetical protein PSECIP111951_03407 [Pseudoalteromonas holothuriae]|uniref:Uncharacterized protein n=1 Tax=Pseudoalteromonas holothuriae TaxID=2963714 RepID=A0ABN8UPW8_9GAMM|nr:hypothetical protein [Pseudoalteromonas sp. CIP111951]CAH9065647.1 hypothetical protein PSECIP111951_03407 [Pseudoalteromonas sp. CIP111951]
MKDLIRGAVITGAILSFGAVSQPIVVDNNNPFLKSKEQKALNEPTGVSVYSFLEEKDFISNLNKDLTHLYDKNSIVEQSYVEVSSSEIPDYDKLVQDYIRHDKDFKKSKMRNALLNNALSNDPSASSFSPKNFSSISAFAKADLSLFIETKENLILESLGGNFIKGRGWDSLTRIIKNDRFGTIIFDEWDFSDENSGVIIDEDAINVSVSPGIIVVKKGSEGRAETILSWVSNSKSYSIRFNKNAYESGLFDELMAIAESINNYNAFTY